MHHPYDEALPVSLTIVLTHMYACMGLVAVPMLRQVHIGNPSRKSQGQCIGSCCFSMFLLHTVILCLQSFSLNCPDTLIHMDPLSGLCWQKNLQLQSTMFLPPSASTAQKAVPRGPSSSTSQNSKTVLVVDSEQLPFSHKIEWLANKQNIVMKPNYFKFVSFILIFKDDWNKSSFH